MNRADAVVVGAGPGGSAAAARLAGAGYDVVLVDKACFPRDKVCGDGLTPGAVAALARLGLTDEAEGNLPGWHRQQGLRIRTASRVLDLPWPERDGWPAHSLTASRSLLDHTLVRHAVRAGARLWTQTRVTGPVFLTSSRRRVAGVSYRRADGAEGVLRAPVVLAADGAGSGLATGLGLPRLANRPLGVAIRAYYRSPQAATPMLEVFLGMGGDGSLLPAYGWLFPLDGGLVNVGWILLDTTGRARAVDYRAVLQRWVASLPSHWGLGPATMVGTPRSAPLPMGFNRKPAVHKGVLLVGDAGGMANPFSGEGIRYALEAGAFAAEAADSALRARSATPLESYASTVARRWGGFYTAGRAFQQLASRPAAAEATVDAVLAHPRAMGLLCRLMVHADHGAGDPSDRLLYRLSRVLPAS
ncbi:MAG TPA: geranylgeranyl reductase family protein [Egibacteraceae bacterium]|nr:geranylgeranyl reductase family protein [Egibacteraceae bacterium]